MDDFEGAEAVGGGRESAEGGVDQQPVASAGSPERRHPLLAPPSRAGRNRGDSFDVGARRCSFEVVLKRGQGSFEVVLKESNIFHSKSNLPPASITKWGSVPILDATEVKIHEYGCALCHAADAHVITDVYAMRAAHFNLSTL